MLKDIEIIKLQRRVSHLERKLVIWASRMKKEVIWRKYMEDWVMNKFNFDLRLQVELKTLEEDGVDEFEKEEIPRDRMSSRLNNGRNRAMQSVSIQRSQQQQQKSSSSAAASITNRRTAESKHSQSQNPKSIPIPPNTTAPFVPFDNSRNTLLPPPPPAASNHMQHQPQQFSNQGLNDGSRNPMSRATLLQQVPPHPQTIRPPTVTITPPHQPPVPVVYYTGGTGGPVESSASFINRQIPCGSNEKSPMIATTHSKKRKVVSEPNAHRPRPLNPVIISTTTIASKPESPEVIVLDQEDNSDCSNASRNHPSSSSATSRIRNNPNLISCSSSSETSVQQLDSFVRNLTTGDENPDFGPRTENADSSSNNEHFDDYLEVESYYSASGYMSRRNDNMQSLEFNIKKILLEYDPESTEATIDQIRRDQNMSLYMKKNITCATADFLMVVYGDNVPRFAKDFMAISLFNFFPFIQKETWWSKIPSKNATGHLEHRINNRRRHLKDERRKITQQEEGNGDTILGLA